MRKSLQLLANPAVRKLVGVDIAIVAGSAGFLAVMGVNPTSLMLVLSGWTSVGALFLAHYLGFKAINAEARYNALTRDFDLEAGIKKISGFIDEADEFFKSKEFKELVSLLKVGGG